MNRGDIWLVNLDPTIGTEINKKRPALIISTDYLGILPLKLIVPITGWQETFNSQIWKIKLTPDKKNKLTKSSALDCYQIRTIDTKRFLNKIGEVNNNILEEVTAAIAILIEHK